MEITQEFLMKAMEERTVLKTKSGHKVIISLYRGSDEKYPFAGLIFDDDDNLYDCELWTSSGDYHSSDDGDEDYLSIVGVWEEPFFFNGVELPEPPLTLEGIKLGDKYFVADFSGLTIYEFTGYDFDINLIKTGRCFRSELGAKAFKLAVGSAVNKAYNDYYDKI